MTHVIQIKPLALVSPCEAEVCKPGDADVWGLYLPKETPDGMKWFWIADCCDYATALTLAEVYRDSTAPGGSIDGLLSDAELGRL